MGIYDVNPEKLIHKVAEQLQKEDMMQPPEWAPYVKTGAHKDRQPTQNNWWYIRAASVLRKLYARGPIGVSKLRVIYGGKKNRGTKPERFVPGSGNILRKILQQLEKSGLAKQVEKDVYKGRVVTPKGHAILEAASSELLKEAGIEIKEKPKVQLETTKKPKKKTTKKKAAKKTVKKAAKKTEQKAEKKKEEKKTEAEKKERPEKTETKESEVKKEEKQAKEPAEEEKKTEAEKKEKPEKTEAKESEVKKEEKQAKEPAEEEKKAEPEKKETAKEEKNGEQ